MNTKTTSHGGTGVQQFLPAHGADVTGVIAGYDGLACPSAPLRVLGLSKRRGSLRHLYPYLLDAPQINESL
jgi:hypothetical protein